MRAGMADGSSASAMDRRASRDRRDRALHRFAVVWLALALGGLAGFLVASEVLLRGWVEPNDLLYRHKHFLATATSGHAVFGDSHAALGFTGLPPFVNLAYPGEDTLTMESKVRRYFADKAPRQVVLQADPNLLSERRNREQDRDYLTESLGVGFGGAVRVLSPWHRPQLLAYWKVALRGEGFHSNRDFRPDGAQTRDVDFSRVEPAARRREAAQSVEEQTPDFTGPAQHGLAALARMARFVQDKGGKVCLVTFPQSPDYRAAAAAVPAYARALREVDALAAELGAGRASLWDAFDDRANFTNADHLNVGTAPIAARRIAAGCGFVVDR
jgi:hypothetical protein